MFILIPPSSTLLPQLQVLGLGTALKILFSNAPRIKLERNEIIALINTFGKFSHAIHIVKAMKLSKARRIWIKWAAAAMIGFLCFVGLPMLICVIVRRRRRPLVANAPDADSVPLDNDGDTSQTKSD